MKTPRPLLHGLRAAMMTGVALGGCAEKWVEQRTWDGEDEGRRDLVIEPLDLVSTANEKNRDEFETGIATELKAAPDRHLDSLRAMLSEAEPGTIRLGLDGFRQSLLANNLHLQVSRFDPAIASNKLKSEYGKLDATFSSTVTASRQLEDASEVGSPKLALETDYAEAESSLSVPLAIGGSIELSADLYRYETLYLNPDPDGPKETAYPSNLSAQVTIPILNGAGYDANLGSIVIAAFDERISMLELRSMMSSLLASSEQVYWQRLRSWRSVEIEMEMLELARNQVTDTEALARGGVVPASQRYRAELTVEKRRAALLSSELNLRRDMRSVKIIMNRPDVPLDPALVVRPTTKPLLHSFVLDCPRLAIQAIENRSELLQTSLQLQQDEVRLRMTRNALLPSLGFDGSIGLLGIGADSPKSISSLLDGQYPLGWSIGLNFTMPIGNRTAEGEYQSAVISRLQTLSKQREMRMQITQDVYDAVERLEITWSRILTYRRAEGDARRNLDAAKHLFRSGDSTSMEVALAIEDLGNARLSVLDSEITYQLAIINLATATGTTLGRQSVEVVSSSSAPPTIDSTNATPDR